MTGKNPKIKKIATGAIILILALVIACAVYINDYYHAGETAISTIAGPASGVVISEKEEGVWSFEPANPEAGIIFYPGGKVQAESYAPLMEALAQENILTVLVSMPGNLAVLDMNAAEGITENFPQVDTWYMSGHSLGGSMASAYLEKNISGFEGLILLASYSTADLSDKDISVLSIYGDRDGVLDMDNYNESKSNLPGDFEEVIISGGCHAYFGDYGPQNGDGKPEISQKQQILQTVTAIKKFMKI